LLLVCRYGSDSYVANLPYGEGLVVYLSYDWYAGTYDDWDTVLLLALVAEITAPTPLPTASPIPTLTMVPTTNSPTSIPTSMPSFDPTFAPSTSPVPTPPPLVLIKMLKDTSYVDTRESTYLAQSIANVGLGNNQGLDQSMTSFTSGTLSTELDGFDCFVVPELERSDFYSALSSTDVTALASWVSEGRVMVVSADSSGRAVSLLNGVFGWSLSLGSTSNGLTASITSAASGTAFEAGPSTLYGPNGNYALTSSSIPSDGSSIYT